MMTVSTKEKNTQNTVKKCLIVTKFNLIKIMLLNLEGVPIIIVHKISYHIIILVWVVDGPIYQRI